VATVFGVVPLREFGVPRTVGSPLLFAQMRGLLGREAPLGHRFDYLREEAAVPGQGQFARIDL
jgi:hypothetical protein